MRWVAPRRGPFGGDVDRQQYRLAMLAGSDRVHGHMKALVEREQHLRTLDGLLDRARGGAGGVVVLRGEPGIGKSAILRAFLADGAARADIALGYCDGVATPRPLSPLYDMAPALGPNFAERLRDHRRDALQDWLMERLSSSTVVLAIEDVQWADEATIDLLRLLARRLPETRSLIAVTYRDEPRAGDGITRLLGFLTTNGATTVIDVPPLSRAGIAALAGGALDARRVHQLTGGNPFFVSEVLAASEDGVVPGSVRDLIQARLVELTDPARRALAAAAILGQRVESWLLAAAAGEDLPGIDEAADLGFVVAGPGGITFRHEITRLAVLEDIPAFQAIALHRSALSALRRGGVNDAARLAHHAEGAADGEAVLDHAVPAAYQALHTGAYREAMLQFRRALRFATDPTQRGAILEALGDACMTVHDGRGADAAWSEALRLVESGGDPRRVGDLMRRTGRAAWWQAQGDRARTLVRDAVGLLEPLGDSPELARAYSAWSAQLMVDGHHAQAIEWGERALALADRLGLEDVRSHALNNIGSSEAAMGIEAGFVKLEESLAIARRLGHDDHAYRALNNLASSSAATQRLRRAESWYAELSRFAETSEARSCDIDANRAEVLLNLGRWDEAVLAARHAIDAGAGRPDIDPHDVGLALTVLGRIAALRGEPEATELVQRGEALLSSAGELPRQYLSLRAHAELGWLSDSLPALVPALRELYDRATDAPEAWIAGDLARWLVQAGEPADRFTLDDIAHPYRLAVQARWMDSAAAWDELENTLEAALARVNADDPRVVREAHAAFSRLGAKAAADRAAQRLAHMGAPIPRGPRRTTARHPALLTVREAEVAAFMADGLSNREIAVRLVLSEKTVGHHASAVLAKLGIHRRAEVARALERSGAA